MQMGRGCGAGPACLAWRPVLQPCSAARRTLPRPAQVTQLLGPPQEVDVGGGTGGLRDAWFPAFRAHQAHEIWRQHGEWVTQHRPSFGPGVRERFEMAAGVTEQQYAAAAAQRAAARQALEGLLGGDAVLLLPTSPGPAPLCGTPAAELDVFRTALLSLTCIAGLSGFPQVGRALWWCGGALWWCDGALWRCRCTAGTPRDAC